MFDDLLPVRAPGVTFYVLRENDALYLIDTGFVGGINLLRRALRRRGWDTLPISGILLTHGHLDHIFNAAAIKRAFGCWLAAPRLDARHYEGTYPYHGPAVVCGILESLGRRIPGFAPFPTDQWIDDGGLFPIWGGLKAVHLPGHTDGHTGFYCAARKVLFSADLFATHGGIAHRPPAIFNSQPELIAASLARAAALDLTGVFPNHCDHQTPERQLERLRTLAAHRRPRPNRRTP